MASINAATSGAGGLITTGDASGELQLQSNGTATLTITTAGNVGVGTTSPTGPADKTLQISGTSPALRVTGTGRTGFDVLQTGGDGVTYLWNRDNAAISFGTNSTERMRIDTSGNVLIGATSTPAPTYGTAKLNISGGTGLIVSGYGDAVGFGSVFEQSASASGNNGWPIYFVDSAEAQVGGIRQKAASVEYWTASSGLGANLINSGVQFPATQVASADANCLDDYEEGTWTPDVYHTSSNNSTWTVKQGKYTKIGNVVYYWINCDGNNSGTAGSALVFTLPIAYAAGSNWQQFGSINASTGMYGAIQQNTSSAIGRVWINGGAITTQVSFITISGSYVAV